LREDLGKEKESLRVFFLWTPCNRIPHDRMPMRGLFERAIRVHAAGQTENAILAVLIPCKEPVLLITAREYSVNRPTTREITR